MSVHGTDEAAIHGVKRSDKWHRVEKDFLAKNPTCAASGITVGNQAHHVIPFHFCILLGRPDLELDERNLINLSESEKGLKETNYHLLIGHADSFKSSNIHVREDAIAFYGKSADEIINSITWQDRVKDRLKSWDTMTDDDKKTLRALMDELYPLVGHP